MLQRWVAGELQGKKQEARSRHKGGGERRRAPATKGVLAEGACRQQLVGDRWRLGSRLAGQSRGGWLRLLIPASTFTPPLLCAAQPGDGSPGAHLALL